MLLLPRLPAVGFLPMPSHQRPEISVPPYTSDFTDVCHTAPMQVVNGSHRGSQGTLQQIDTSRFQAQVRLSNGKELWLEYEDVCKLA